jgi:hypothetical protein
MSILLIAVGVVFGLYAFIKLLQAAEKNRPAIDKARTASFRRGLPETFTRDELITHAEAFWAGLEVITLPKGRTITACAGDSTYVLRRADNSAELICEACARKLIRAEFTDQAVQSGAMRALRRMWYTTTHQEIPGYRGVPKMVPEELGDPFPCAKC